MILFAKILLVLVLSLCLSCSSREVNLRIQDDSIFNGRAILDYNSAEWLADAVTRTYWYGPKRDSAYQVVELRFLHPDKINEERLLMYFPKRSEGVRFAIPSLPNYRFYGRQGPFPYAYMLTNEIDQITELYDPYSVTEQESFFQIDTITENGDHIGRFEIYLTIDTLTLISRRKRPDNFALLEGRFHAFNLDSE